MGNSWRIASIRIELSQTYHGQNDIFIELVQETDSGVNTMNICRHTLRSLIPDYGVGDLVDITINFDFPTREKSKSLS